MGIKGVSEVWRVNFRCKQGVEYDYIDDGDSSVLSKEKDDDDGYMTVEIESLAPFKVLVGDTAEIYPKEEPDNFGLVVWDATQILELKPEWDVAKARDFLWNIEDQLRETQYDAGLLYIERLLEKRYE